jgi:hypothetical protein
MIIRPVCPVSVEPAALALLVRLAPLRCWQGLMPGVTPRSVVGEGLGGAVRAAQDRPGTEARACAPLTMTPGHDASSSRPLFWLWLRLWLRLWHRPFGSGSGPGIRQRSSPSYNHRCSGCTARCWTAAFFAAVVSVVLPIDSGCQVFRCISERKKL